MTPLLILAHNRFLAAPYAASHTHLHMPALLRALSLAAALRSGGGNTAAHFNRENGMTVTLSRVRAV